MTIRDVCEKYNISSDTLRYYERVGAIPAVRRTKGGIRDYSGQDLSWVENAICMRNAGVPVEMIVEYVKLYMQGDETLAARRDLLKRARQEIIKHISRYQQELERIEYKIEKYDEAVKTGKLVWDREISFDGENGFLENVSEERGDAEGDI